MKSYSIAEYRRLCGRDKKHTAKSKRPSRGEKVDSEGEATLSLQLKASKISFEREFKFHANRKWRADFHLIDRQILIEVEGGLFSGGRHTRGKGYINDMEKYNSATMMGYQVIRFSTEQVRSGKAIQEILKMVGE